MIGVVLAGGASTRFGGKPKGLQLLGKKPLALHVANMFASFAAPIVIEAPRGAGYEALNGPLIHARLEDAGKGPLAGIAAGLALMDERERLAHADPRVAFAPCDMPKLNARVYRTLAAADERGAYARTAQGDEPLVAVLSPDMHAVLIEALSRDRVPRTVEVLAAAGARAVDFDDSEFFVNVNTPQDLARLQALLPPEGPEPAPAFFEFLRNLDSAIDALHAGERATWSRRQARALLDVLTPHMPAPVLEIFQSARAGASDLAAPLNAAFERHKKAGGKNGLEYQILCLLNDLVGDQRPMDAYEVTECAVIMVRLGVSEADLVRAYVEANPTLGPAAAEVVNHLKHRA